MDNKLSRRSFIKLIASASIVTGFSFLFRERYFIQQSLSQAIDQNIYLPLVARDKSTPIVKATPTASQETPPPLETQTPSHTATPTNTATPTPTVAAPLGARVIHTHSDQATFWDRSNPKYWNYVNQDVVNEMIDQGLMALTGTASITAAWNTLLPNYQSNQKIAIKVSFNNNYTSCSGESGAIDGIIQPVNSLIRGLQQIGVQGNNIWIYDTIRSIPDRFVSGCLYAGVRYFDAGCREPAGWNSPNPSALVSYTPPAPIPAPPPSRIADVLVNADYLINIPIMKWHPVNGVSLAFKNHFGTIQKPGELHDYIGVGYSHYTSDYSCLVKLYQSENLHGKTILTVCDGLFAAKYYTVGPEPWATFGNKFPNSLYFATDPVAVESVVCDFVDAEVPVMNATRDYIRLAEQGGLGVFEQGNPWGSGYDRIVYNRIEV